MFINNHFLTTQERVLLEDSGFTVPLGETCELRVVNRGVGRYWWSLMVPAGSEHSILILPVREWRTLAKGWLDQPCNFSYGPVIVKNDGSELYVELARPADSSRDALLDLDEGEETPIVEEEVDPAEVGL